MINVIARVIGGLYSNKKPGEVAAAICWAVVLALIPGMNLLWFFLFGLMFFIKINQAITLLLIPVLVPVLGLLDPVLHRVGYTVLTAPGLHGFYTTLYGVPLIPFTRFNNTLVAGGLVAGILVSIPLFFLARLGVMQFRLKVVPRILGSKPVAAFARTPLVSTLVRKIKGWSDFYAGIR
jgi:uncharacterized protein (TIGR03546 family)